MFLKLVMNPGDLLLLYDVSIGELADLDSESLSKRLYRIRGFENDGMRVILQRHINAQTDKELGKGESPKVDNLFPEKIRCSVKKLNFIKEGVHFLITPNGIRFI